jgi:hypothetical protein
MIDPRSLLPPSDPPADARVPALAVNLALVIVGMALSVAGYGVSGWLVLGGALCVSAACAPQTLFAWALILFLTAGQLTHRNALSWRLAVLLAGIHLVHILAMLTLKLPRRSWLQPAVLLAPLKRFVAIQLPIQALAVVALLLLRPGRRPLSFGPFSVVGAAALVGLGLILLRGGRRGLASDDLSLSR